MAVGLENNTMMPLSDRQKSVTIRQIIQTHSEGRTDGRTCNNDIALCIHCMLTRDNDIKNCQVAMTESNIILSILYIM